MAKKTSFTLNLSSIKVIISLVIIVTPLLVSGGYKIFELIRYEGLKYAKDDNERYRYHMDEVHLYADDQTRTDHMLSLNGKKISVWTFASDGCALVRWIDHRGMVLLTKVLPDPSLILNEKDSVTWDWLPKVYAGGNYKFDFGVHAKDRYDDYKDFPQRDKHGYTYFLRIYGDDCQLIYRVDRQGYSYGWKWTLYRHNVR